MASRDDDQGLTESQKVEEKIPEASKDDKKEEVDAELDALLDSALDDFDKAPPNQPEGANAAASEGKGAENASAGNQSEELSEASQEAMFEELFKAAAIGEEGSKQFQDAMNLLMGQEPDLAQQIQKLAQAAGTADDSEESEKHFTETLQQTLGSLSENASELQSELSEEDLMRAMSGLGLEGGMEGDQEMGFMPMMQHMMKSLLSKEVLYPSLKEISSKYPDWLTDNKDKITQTEYDNYNKQFNLMTRICSEFEEEELDDSQDVKSQRFERIIDLMQQMQECGQPPKEIVGDMMPGMDATGFPQMPNVNPDQCSLM